MMDFMKYAPLEWRRQDNYCTPKGPDWSKAKEVQCLIGGSRLRFSAPPHEPYRRFIKEIKPSAGPDELAIGLDRLNLQTDSVKNNFWRSRVIFSRRWAFRGPWMSGTKAELLMAVAIIGREESHEYQDVSFFHPRVFENVLVDSFNANYGTDVGESGYPDYQGPIDWSAEKRLPVFSASCKMYRLMRHSDPFDPDSLFIFPVTDKHFVQITFSTRSFSEDKSGPCFDTKPVAELQQYILQSFQLELGSEAKAEWDRVASECPDMSLTESFAPLKWPIDPSEQVSAVDGSLEYEREKLAKPA